jgi:hypothetical protein
LRRLRTAEILPYPKGSAWSETAYFRRKPVQSMAGDDFPSCVFERQEK